ncbi:MAG TPA: Zn-ribbon domain-containing OB-fold protein [Candidatus Binatia bacterium]|nr:Zn-ribbon domain-containing OB-fold protein [Candidatus Binatia bacterium]
MELERPLPQPITPEARPYWDGLREHRLMLPRCRDCGKAFFYPRVLCPFCHGAAIDWIQASGRGRLYSFEIAYQTINKAFKVKPPYVLAMVELEEGPRLMSNLINVAADPAVLRCDMPVEIVFHQLTDDITVPLFQPAGSAR